MRSKIVPAALAAASALFIPCTAAASAATVRTLENEAALTGATMVQVDIGVGELVITGSNGDKVKTHVEVHCADPASGDCKQAADKISVGDRRRGEELLIEIEGYPKFGDKGLSLVARVEVPRNLHLSVDAGVGEVEVSNMTNDLDVDVRVGDVEVTMDAAALASVELDAGVGDVELTIGGQTIEGSGLVGKGLEWNQGKGRARLEVDCGVGDIEVTLQ